MTKIWEDHTVPFAPYSGRKALRNFTWTDDAINDWEEIWHDLWHLGYKWEWQNSDRYARRRGKTFNKFAVYNDALRLDMAIPLPGITVVEEIKESLLDDPSDDERLGHAVGAITRWLKRHHLSSKKGTD